MAARWLSDDEQATWRALLLTMQLLDEALDRQLRRDAGMPHAYYAILAGLNDAPGQTSRMSDLAASLWFSQSRLTHAVASLERAGWVARQQCPTDRRGQLAALTEAGRDALRAAAPGHVAEVRARVFDPLSPEQVASLREACQTLLVGLEDPTDRTQPGPCASGPAPRPGDGRHGP